MWRKLERPCPLRLASVGVPALDSDHRCLFRIVDLLLGIEDADDASAMVPTVLETIWTYAWFHFQREERVMAAVDFPEARLHRNEHREFTRRLERLRRTHDAACSPADAARLWFDLTGWLRHHILIQDMAFKPLVTDAEAADQVARAGIADGLATLGGLPAPPHRWEVPPSEAFAFAL